LVVLVLIIRWPSLLFGLYSILLQDELVGTQVGWMKGWKKEKEEGGRKDNDMSLLSFLYSFFVCFLLNPFIELGECTATV